MKAKVTLKTYDATNWSTSNYHKHIARYLKSLDISNFLMSKNPNVDITDMV